MWEDKPSTFHQTRTVELKGLTLVKLMDKNPKQPPGMYKTL